MPSIKEAIKAAGFVLIKPQKAAPPADAPVVRQPHEKLIGEGPYVSDEAREALGWRPN